MPVIEQLNDLYLYLVKNKIKLGTMIEDRKTHMVLTIIKFNFFELYCSARNSNMTMQYLIYFSNLMANFDVIGQSEKQFTDSELLEYEENIKALKKCINLRVGQSFWFSDQLFVITEITDSIKGVLLKEGAKTINDLDETYVYTYTPFGFCRGCANWKKSRKVFSQEDTELIMTKIRMLNQ